MDEWKTIGWVEGNHFFNYEVNKSGQVRNKYSNYLLSIRGRRTAKTKSYYYQMMTYKKTICGRTEAFGKTVKLDNIMDATWRKNE